MGPTNNFQNYFLETAIKIIMLSLSWEKNSEKFSGLLKVNQICLGWHIKALIMDYVYMCISVTNI